MEELVEVFPNEMLARMWADILEADAGIKSVVKPQYGGYGLWGQDPFIPHGLYVLTDYAETARKIINERSDS